MAQSLRNVGGEYVLPFEFESLHGERTSHHVIFVSKEFIGYHIMKDIMSKQSTDNGEVRRLVFTPTQSPQLRFLFELLRPHNKQLLKELLHRRCAGKTQCVWDVYRENTVDTPYTLRNVQDALIELESEKLVTVDKPREKRIRAGQVTLGKDRVVRFRQ
jgi:hypothetical protein